MKQGKRAIVFTILVGILVIVGIFIVKNNDSKNTNNIVNNESIEIENNVNNVVDDTNQISENNTIEIVTHYINSIEDIELKDVDGMSKNYSFRYNNEVYTAVYTTDNWHINNSYKITNQQDIIIICKALISEHQIHGKDMTSYRTAEDMADEWLQHNLAYNVLPEESSWKDNARDVDLNPEDQGKSLLEMYNARASKN